MTTPPRSPARRAFSLVEASISMLIVALMLGAGMAAMGISARDRLARAQARQGEALAARLLTEILQRRFEFPAGSGIGRAAGTPTSDRTAWLDVDDYADLDESPPRDRLGRTLAGTTGWRWRARVEYVDPGTLSSVASTTPAAGPLISANLSALSLDVGGTSASPAQTRLKRVTVLVSSPSRRTTTLQAFRSSTGAVDRVASAPGFRPYAAIDLTVGPDSRAVQTGVPLLNNPSR